MTFSSLEPDRNGWFTVEVQDQFPGRWQWGQGPYEDWCEHNCTGAFSVSKYSRDTIFVRFSKSAEATLFALRWS